MIEGTSHTVREHVISYAFPYSRSAVKRGFGNRGCYMVAERGRTIAVADYHQAVLEASKLGTVPGRWSIDHPSNAHLSGPHNPH